MKIRGNRLKLESWFTEKRTPISSGKALYFILPHKRPVQKHKEQNLKEEEKS